MNESFSSKKILIIVVTISLVAYTLLAYLVWGVLDKGHDVEDLMLRAQEETEKSLSLHSVEEIVKTHSEDFAFIDSLFVADEEIVDFISLVEFLGEETGVELTVNSVDLSEEADNRVLQFEVGLVGAWQEVFGFLLRLENLPFRIDMHRSSFGVETQGALEESVGKNVLWKGIFEFDVFMKESSKKETNEE